MAEGGPRNQGRDDHGPENVRIMTLNIGGLAKGFSVLDRQVAAKNVMKNVRPPPDIVCLQEIMCPTKEKWDFEKFEDVNLELPKRYNNSYKNNGKEVGLLWNTNKFKEVDKLCIQKQMRSFISSHYVTSDNHVIRWLVLNDEVNAYAEAIDDSCDAISERSCVVKLQSKGTNAEIIIISYHGRYIGLNVQDKKRDIQVLQMLAKYLRDTNNIPVVIGGDFNLMPDKVIEYEGFKVQTKGEDKPDYFITTNGTEITEIDEKADIQGIKDEHPDWGDKSVELKKIFGHTAIFGRLTLPMSYRQRIERLEDEVKRIKPLEDEVEQLTEQITLLMSDRERIKRLEDEVKELKSKNTTEG